MQIKSKSYADNTETD